MFAHLLPVFAAMDGVSSSDGKTSSNGIAEYPDEEPTDKELGDWLDDVSPPIRARFGALLRGETPVHLKQFEGGADDLTGFTLLPDSTANMRPDQIQTHNRKVREAMAAKQNRAELLAQGLRDHKNQLAELLKVSLRPRAELKLNALL